MHCRRSCCACSSRASSCASAASSRINVDVRIIAATNRDLERGDARTARFRADLFYRLNVVAVHLPPLRERPRRPAAADPALRRARSAREIGIPEKRRQPEAVDALLRYPWPGNVRELENVIERMLVLVRPRPDRARGPAASRCASGRVETSSIQQQVLRRREDRSTDAVDEFEREIIAEPRSSTSTSTRRARPSCSARPGASSSTAWTSSASQRTIEPPRSRSTLRPPRACQQWTPARVPRRT